MGAGSIFATVCLLQGNIHLTHTFFNDFQF